VVREIEESQDRIRKEFEEKGYVYVPDGYLEEVDRCNTEAYESAYLKVFGCLPPKEEDD
jgi:ATP phosphoribosyltransferase regulatory subunit HisZ